MSTWKKVLLNGADLTSADFTKNKSDVTGGAGITVTGNTSTCLIGEEGDDLDIAISITGLAVMTDDSGADPVATTDKLIVDDSGTIKVVSIADAVAAVSSGVTTIEFTTDEVYDHDDDDGTADVAQSTGADAGAVSVKFEGGSGVSTSIKTNQGDNVVLIDAVTATSGANSGSATKGIASFDSDDFNVGSGFVAIATNGVKAGNINAEAVTNGKIAAGAVDDGKIASSGITTNGKVKFSALDFGNATSVSAGALAASDTFIIDRGATGDGTANQKATISQLNTLLGGSGNIGDIGTMHNGVGPSGGFSHGSANTGSIDVIAQLVVDANGHVTAVDNATIPSAASNAAGIVSTGAQNFAGNKTFDNNLDVTGNLTVVGNLTIEGTTTTIESTTLTVTDEKITLASLDPDSADYVVSNAGNGDANTAANNGGIILQSHSGSEEDKFAALTWSKDTALSGWQVRDTATYANDDPEQDVESADHALSIMQFGANADAPVDNTTLGHGLGSFFCTTDGVLYFRTA